MSLSGNGNHTQHPRSHFRSDVLTLAFRLTGAGAAAPVDKDAGHYGSLIESVTYDAEGVYTIVPNRKYQGAIEGVSVELVGTLEAQAKLTALDLTAPTMTLKVTKNADGVADDLEAADSVYITIDVRTKTRN